MAIRRGLITPDSQASDLAAIKRLVERGRPTEAYARCVSLAEAGSPAARLYVGWMHQSGKGVEKKPQDAERWYLRAIRPNSGDAEFCLATLYWESGDLRPMLEWFERSASKRYAPAMYELGRIYRVGHGVRVDSLKALKYTEEAANLGHLFARRELAGEMLRGRQGRWRIPLGFFAMIGITWAVVRIGWKDPYGDAALTLRRHFTRDV